MAATTKMPSKKEETESQRLVEDDPQRFGYRLYRKAWEELLFQKFEQHLKLGGEGKEVSRRARASVRRFFFRFAPSKTTECGVVVGVLSMLGLHRAD